MKGTLYIRRDLAGKLIPAPEGIAGELTYGWRNAFLLDSDEHIIVTLENARIDDIIISGIHLSGSQRDLTGGLIYQQWWFRTAD